MVNKARLRMAAGSCLLKLLQNTNYVDVITVDQYQQMALLMQVWTEELEYRTWYWGHPNQVKSCFFFIYEMPVLVLNHHW